MPHLTFINTIFSVSLLPLLLIIAVVFAYGATLAVREWWRDEVMRHD